MPNEVLAKLTSWNLTKIREKQREVGKAHVLEVSFVIKLNKAFQQARPDAETLVFNMKERRQPAERACKKYATSYPIEKEFFKVDKQKDKKFISYLCQVCASFDSAKYRFKKPRKKHG